MTENLTLHQLAEHWQQAKSAEVEAIARRHHVEERIAALIPGTDEGTTSQTDDGLKIVVTRKLNRTIDPVAYEQARLLIPAEYNPIKTKLEIDIRKLRAVEAANHTVYSLCQQFITVKPAKPSIDVREVEEVVNV